MNLIQVRTAILVLLSIASISDAWQESGQSDDGQKPSRLNVRTEEKQTSLVNLDGFVKSKSKYSFEVDTGSSVFPVKLAEDAKIKLKVVSPRIDFDKKQLIIDVEGAEKRYRGYPIPVPLYIKINLVHQKQLDRIAQQQVKRIATFELMANRSTVTKDKSLQWIGEIKKGDSNRQLKFYINKKSYDVLLGKKGSMTGFSISDLKAEITAVRVSGKLRDDGVIIANEVLFWPTASYRKQTADSK